MVKTESGEVGKCREGRVREGTRRNRSGGGGDGERETGSRKERSGLPESLFYCIFR